MTDFICQGPFGVGKEQVEELMDRRIGENGKIEYLLEWKGHKGHRSWVQEEDLLDCEDLIRDGISNQSPCLLFWA